MAATRDNSSSARTSRRRTAAAVTPPGPPQTVQELAAAIIGLIRRFRERQGSNAQTDAALALAIADRENFRVGRR